MAFILEGLPAVILGIVTLFIFTDRPRHAQWLTEAERNYLEDTLAAGIFAANTGGYALGFWLPTTVKSLSGGSGRASLFFSGLFYFFGIVGVLYAGYSSDRRGDSKWHCVAGQTATGIFLAASAVPGQPFWLSGKVALVTGAAQGLGRAMATALAEAGADLLLVDRNEAAANATVAEIASLGRRAVVAVHDISEPAQVRALFQTLDAQFGRIDFLGNVAGEAVLGAPETISLEDVEQVWRNLVLGRFCACQEAGRRMIAAGAGSIVNIGSIASLTALGRGHIAYSMAMAAVVQMTRELSAEWSSSGVRVNAILPAQVLNPGLERRIAEDPALKDKFLSGIPTGRFGHPNDIKGLSVLLASDASKWITGAIVPMDGGNLALNAGGSIRKPK